MGRPDSPLEGDFSSFLLFSKRSVYYLRDRFAILHCNPGEEAGACRWTRGLGIVGDRNFSCEQVWSFCPENAKDKEFIQMRRLYQGIKYDVEE
jgi:hypothetical protein